MTKFYKLSKPFNSNTNQSVCVLDEFNHPRSTPLLPEISDFYKKHLTKDDYPPINFVRHITHKTEDRLTLITTINTLLYQLQLGEEIDFTEWDDPVVIVGNNINCEKSFQFNFDNLFDGSFQVIKISELKAILNSLHKTKNASEFFELPKEERVKLWGPVLEAYLTANYLRMKKEKEDYPKAISNQQYRELEESALIIEMISHPVNTDNRLIILNGRIFIEKVLETSKAFYDDPETFPTYTVLYAGTDSEGKHKQRIEKEFLEKDY